VELLLYVAFLGISHLISSYLHHLIVKGRGPELEGTSLLPVAWARLVSFWNICLYGVREDHHYSVREHQNTAEFRASGKIVNLVRCMQGVSSMGMQGVPSVGRQQTRHQTPTSAFKLALSTKPSAEHVLLGRSFLRFTKEL
jgi:hypothetical protein